MCPVLLIDPAVLKPGYYAVSITLSSRAVTAAAICPQGFICPGNVAPVAAFDPSDPTALSATEPSIQVCASGLWTKDVGATSPNQCSKWFLLAQGCFAPAAGTEGFMATPGPRREPDFDEIKIIVDG